MKTTIIKSFIYMFTHVSISYILNIKKTIIKIFSTERNLLLGFISRQKLKKRTGKNVAFFKRTEKNGMFRTEKNAVPNPEQEATGSGSTSLHGGARGYW